MSQVPAMKVLLPLLILANLAACTTAEKWSASGGNRDSGVVRVSYDYPEFHQPVMRDADAEALALNRCHAWGYAQAEPIAGQIRQCSNVESGNCNLWTVTREYQCTGGDGSYVSRLSR